LQIHKSTAFDSARVSESIENILIVQAFNAEQSEIDQYTNKIRTLSKKQQMRAFYRAVYFSLVAALSMFIVGFLFWTGQQLVLQQKLSTKEVIQFLGIVILLANNLSSTSASFGQITEATAAANNLLNLSAKYSKRTMLINSANLTKGRICFDSVDFAYSQQDQLVLENLSFEIEPQTLVAITGTSGSGKSTLIALLLGFVQPKAGTICVDGVDILTLSPRHLRKLISYTPQQVTLFTDSVLENIRYGTPTASIKAVVAAARDSMAHEFIERLPQRYQTIVQQATTGLSGGQAQRVGLARGILRQAIIYIFDEPTAWLDATALEHFALKLRALSRTSTVVVVTHDERLLKHVDYQIALPLALTQSSVHSTHLFNEVASVKR
jgi:ATP-binding cassette, subfamily B, bacterial